MARARTERMLNLLFVLLNSRTPLTREQIRERVPGYGNSNEAFERMFERDKDDLRSLGIEIEVGSFDPLFNDEAGYRIKQEKYQFELSDITSTEVSLLSLAAQAWQEASFGDVAQKALLKLRSIGVPSDELTIPGAVHKLDDGGQDLALISKAIAQHELLSFTYLDSLLNQGDFARISDQFMYGMKQSMTIQTTGGLFKNIVKSVDIMLKNYEKEKNIYPDYSYNDVSTTVVNIIQSYTHYIMSKTWFK